MTVTIKNEIDKPKIKHKFKRYKTQINNKRKGNFKKERRKFKFGLKFLKKHNTHGRSKNKQGKKDKRKEGKED